MQSVGTAYHTPSAMVDSKLSAVSTKGSASEDSSERAVEATRRTAREARREKENASLAEESSFMLLVESCSRRGWRQGGTYRCR